MASVNLDPASLAFITSLTMNIIEEFRSRNIPVTEAEIEARANTLYASFAAKNQKLLADAVKAAMLGK